MRTAAMLALVLTVGSAAAAMEKAPAKHKAKPASEIACPVMPKNKVAIAKATKDKMFADWKGNRYFFCCAGCPDAFKKNPAKFAKAPHIPTPKAKKG
jgi:YHS domain-containing protein